MASSVRSIRLKDVQATCLAYDWANGNVILPGRRTFMFVPLGSSELTVPAKYNLRQAAVSDATRIYSNPENPATFAIARGQSFELYEFNKIQSQTEICTKKLEIQAHNKLIDDFSWCPYLPHWLVTCSRDQYAYLWDVSKSDTVSSFRATSPISCCCWLFTGKSASLSFEKPSSPSASAQMSGLVVALTADSRLLIWDIRASSRPAVVVQAHTQRIHALDAGSAPSEQYQLITAADGESRMALWDIRNLDRKLSSIDSPFGNQAPRRVRFSPAGGMLLVSSSTMPRPATIDEPRAAVIPISDSTGFILHGHMDHVYDAIWPSKDSVVTWSQDFYLRQFEVGSRQSILTLSSADSSISGGIASSMSDNATTISGGSTPNTPPSYRPDALANSHGSQSTDKFPSSIPSSASILPLVSPQPLPIIPQPPPLPTQIVSSTNLAGSGTQAVQFSIAPSDYNIPSPRTAGARFCAAGFLVSLHRLYELKEQPNKRALADFTRAFSVHSAAGGRPRTRNRHTSFSRQSEGSGSGYSGVPSTGYAMTAGVLTGAVSPSSGGILHHHHHQYSSQSSTMTSSGSGLTISALPSSSTLTAGSSGGECIRQHSVLIYSVNTLLKCNRELAIELRLDWTKPADCCRENVGIALALDRPDLAQAFSVAALVLDGSTLLTKPDLVMCIGRDALIRMFAHYVKQGCLQDAAILAYFLSFTGIDLNNTPDDLGAMSPNDTLASIHGNRTPPSEPTHIHNSSSLVPLNVSDGQSSEGYLMYDHYTTVGPAFLRRPHPTIQVSAVKRSSSWHDVQNVSPDGSTPNPDGNGSAIGDTRSRPGTSSRHHLSSVSPQQSNLYTNRLVQMTAARHQQQDGSASICHTPYTGLSESERIQMSVVLRSYATQLQAWRLHDRRTALLRPLNAVSAGQLNPFETNPNDTTKTAGIFIESQNAMATLPVTSRLTNSALGRSNITFHHQNSIEMATIPVTPSSNLASQQSSQSSIVVCSVCERPVRGLSSICVLCGHGGHAVHIREFFTRNISNISCPTGCGCRCPTLQIPYIEL